jgi:dihydropteroate synthase
MIWKLRNREIDLNVGNPLIMGIVNLTPDSFYQSHSEVDQALDHAEAMLEHGATILDLGAESTRHNAQAVNADEEWARLEPVLRELRKRHPDVLISIDTYKASVAQRACECGADIINDVGAGLWDAEMLRVISQNNVGYICMHSQGRPQTMQENPSYKDVVSEVSTFFQQRHSELQQAGVHSDSVVFDVGIGFGKKLEHNLALIKHAGTLATLQRPLLWGVSRKSFITHATGVSIEDRMVGGLAVLAHLLTVPLPFIWRTHDVKEAHQFLKMHQQIN